MTPTVHTHFSGSPCVVELTPRALEPGSNGTYIDTRRHRAEGFHEVELVVGGHVRQRWCESTEDAPERIISIMKEFAR